MTLRNKIFYKYVEAIYTKENYLQDFDKEVVDFFNDRNITAVWCSENSSPTKYILIMIYTELDTDVLIDAAKDFAKEFDVIFSNLIKVLNVHFEDNKKIGTDVDEYRLLFESKGLI